MEVPKKELWTNPCFFFVCLFFGGGEFLTTAHLRTPPWTGLEADMHSLSPRAPGLAPFRRKELAEVLLPFGHIAASRREGERWLSQEPDWGSWIHMKWQKLEWNFQPMGLKKEESAPKNTCDSNIIVCNLLFVTCGPKKKCPKWHLTTNTRGLPHLFNLEPPNASLKVQVPKEVLQPRLNTTIPRYLNP